MPSSARKLHKVPRRLVADL